MFWYSVICVLPFTVCLIWTVIFLLDGRKGWTADRRMLCLFTAVSTLLYLGHAVHFLDAPPAFSLIDVLYAGVNLAVYPLFFLYLKTVADVKGVARRDWLLLLPAAFVFLFALIVYLNGGCESAVKSVFLCNKIFFPLTVLYTLVAGQILLRKYNKSIRNFYAETEKKTLEDLSVLLLLFVITSLLSTVVSIIGRDAFAGRFPLAIPSLLFSALLFSVCYVASRLPFTAQDMMRDLGLESDKEIEEPAVEKPQEDASASPEGLHAELMQRLDAMVREKKLYKKQGLKITDLAALAGTNRTYVSNAINQQLGLTFSEYINRLRVEEAKRLIRESDGKMVMVAVAEESGFIGEASFYRHFRQLEGMTPMEWWQSIEQ